VTLLRQIEVGSPTARPHRKPGNEAEIMVQAYYRWRKEHGGLKLEQAKRMKEHVAEAPGGRAVA
jgi:putative transposase